MPRQQVSATKDLDSYLSKNVEANCYLSKSVELNNYLSKSIEMDSYFDVNELAAQIGKVQATHDGKIIVTSGGRKIRVFT